MSFNTFPQNPFPSNSEMLQKLDEVAKAIDNMPTFTSNDKAFLDELPAFPSTDGKKVLTATTESGETSLTYEEVTNELPAEPSADGKKVLTATTESGETVLSWEEPATNVPSYSTDEQKTGQKWIDGKDIYTKTVNCGTLPNNNTKVVGAEITAETVIKMDAFGIDANSTLPIPRIATGSNGIDIYYTYSSNSIVLTTFKDMTTHTAYITLFYTKIESED